MMEEQDSIRIRSCSNNNTDSVVDRISALPDCILGHILSFLPITTAAVATSLLSKRWKFLWLDVHNLEFRFIYIYEPEDSARSKGFIQFVNRVLLLTNGRQLNKFSLVWLSAIPSHLVCWIDAALSRNVHEIDIILGLADDSPRSLQFPINGFNCDSLRSLSLQLHSDSITFVYDTTEVCLPRLETLILGNCYFTSKEAFEKLIDGCPVLHHLELSIFPDDGAEEDIMYHKLSSPSLTYLDIYIGDRCTLKLMAPSLEYLKLEGYMSQFQILEEKSLSSLVTADLDIVLDDRDFSHNLIVGVVRALEHAKILILSASVIEALSLATTSLSTKFKRLKKLVVTTDCCCCYLQDLVHSSENLEKLVIYQAEGRHTSDVPHDHSRWTDPVPSCLSKTLKKVRFTGYRGFEDQLETICFMLEHGIALEVVEIHYEYREDGEKLHKEICEFPRKSPACQVYTIN